MAINGNLLGGLAQGFASTYIPAKAEERRRAENEELKKLQLKQIKANLDLLEQQANVRGTVMNRMSPDVGPPMSLADMLAKDPGTLLSSGLVDAKDILQEQRLSRGQDLFKQLTEQFSGNAPSGLSGNVDPLSLLAASQSGDLSKLRSRDVGTATIQTPEGPMVVQFPKDDPTQQTIIGPAKEEKVTPEQSGRITGLMQASDIVSNFREKFISPDGQVTLSTFDLANMTAGTPRTDGLLYRRQFEDAIDSVIRARTGAAANADEMKNMINQFMPQLGDKPEGIVDKLNRLEAFVNGSLDAATLPKSIRDKLDKAESKQTITVDNDLYKRLQELRGQ